MSGLILTAHKQLVRVIINTHFPTPSVCPNSTARTPLTPLTPHQVPTLCTHIEYCDVQKGRVVRRLKKSTEDIIISWGGGHFIGFLAARVETSARVETRQVIIRYRH